MTNTNTQLGWAKKFCFTIVFSKYPQKLPESSGEPTQKLQSSYSAAAHAHRGHFWCKLGGRRTVSLASSDLARVQENNRAPEQDVYNSIKDVTVVAQIEWKCTQEVVALAVKARTMNKCKCA